MAMRTKLLTARISSSGESSRNSQWEDQAGMTSTSMVLPIPRTSVLFKNMWAQSVFRKNDEVHLVRTECVMRNHQSTSLLVLSVLLLPVGCLAQSSGAGKSTETLATVGSQSITEDDL